MLVLLHNSSLTLYIFSLPTHTSYRYLQFYSIIPRLLGGSNKGALWLSSLAYISLTSPVDLDTFHIKEHVWPELLSKTSVFIKLGSYLVPENNRPPYKGVYIYYILLLFPIKQQL